MNAPIVWQLTTDRIPPADHALECRILSAVLSGTVRPRDLAISADDFFADINRLFWAELREARDPADIAAVVSASKINGPIREELETLRDGYPFMVPAHVDAACERVRELAAQRRLLEVMQDIDAKLRIGASDVKGARALLSEFFRGAK